MGQQVSRKRVRIREAGSGGEVREHEVRETRRGTPQARRKRVRVRDTRQQVEYVVVDRFSGSRSLEVKVKALRRKLRVRLHYVGFDIQEHVYSHAQKKWVRNTVVDLMRVPMGALWRKAQVEVRNRTNTKADLQLLLVATSPCCKTFSKTDSINVKRGSNYRLHLASTPHRPPRDSTSEKGRAAMEADVMVNGEIRMARWCAHKGVHMYMENPVGSLWRREYVVEWEREGWVQRREVHYCAYRHHYHKPTHTWTTMLRWKPRGTRRDGTGRCEQRCKWGFRNAKGRWEHRFKIAQQSQQGKSGVGRKAAKMMMPSLLHEELLMCAYNQKVM